MARSRVLVIHIIIPYEGPESANQNERKLGVFYRKSEGSHCNPIIILTNVNLSRDFFQCNIDAHFCSIINRGVGTGGGGQI